MYKLFTRRASRDARPADIVHEQRPERRRQRTLMWIIAAATAISVTGIGASTWVKSPQQLAAEAAPPKPSLLTAPVERRVLRQTIVLRGTVTAGKTVKVTAGQAVEGKSVVTRSTVHQGQRIRAGKVIAEISGRPIIALPGGFPAYRDIHEGANGPDVRELQQALRAIGYTFTDTLGKYGASTQKAVERLFRDRGYEPAGESPDDAAPKRSSRRHGGVLVRAAEVAFIPKFPATVTEVKAGLGAEVAGTVLSLSAGDLVVRGVLSPDDRKLVSPQKPVSILDEGEGTEINGHVSSIGSMARSGGSDAEGTPSDRQAGYPMVVRSDHRLPESMAGMDVRLTIETASTRRPVLVVPASAIFANADGSTRVVKVLGDGRQQQANVTTGPSSGGFVAVESDQLAEGDRVTVGR